MARNGNSTCYRTGRKWIPCVVGLNSMCHFATVAWHRRGTDLWAGPGFSGRARRAVVFPLVRDNEAPLDEALDPGGPPRPHVAAAAHPPSHALEPFVARHQPHAAERRHDAGRRRHLDLDAGESRRGEGRRRTARVCDRHARRAWAAHLTGGPAATRKEPAAFSLPPGFGDPVEPSLSGDERPRNSGPVCMKARTRSLYPDVADRSGTVRGFRHPRTPPPD